jgi:ankyrin repeat protein
MEEEHQKNFALAQTLRQTFRELVDACMSTEDDVHVLRERVNRYLCSTPEVCEDEVYREFRDGHRRTLLHIASQSGNAAIASVILGSAPDLVDDGDDEQTTPLMLAAQADRFQVAEALFRYGASPNRQNTDGSTAAHYAADSGSVHVLRLLISQGVDLTLQSKAGTPLHWAAGAGQLHVLQTLLEAGVDVNAPNVSGLSAVILAAASGNDSCVVELVRHGADIGSVLTGDLTVLHICAELGCEHAVREILLTPTGMRCASLKSTQNQTPAELAALNGHYSTAEFLWPYSNLPTTLDQFMEMCAKGSEADQSQVDTDANRRDETSARAVEPTTHACSAEDELLSERLKAEGNAAYAQKNYTLAIEKYSAALRHKCDNHILWSNRSACLMALGQPERALADAEMCRKLKPDWSKACYRMAVARFALALYEDAAVAAFEGLKLEENNQELKKLLADSVEQGRKAHLAATSASETKS